MLLDKDVHIKSQNDSAPEFNLIGFGTMLSEMEIGDWTNEINRMIVKIPLADNFTNDDGAIEFRDNTVDPGTIQNARRSQIGNQYECP